MPPRQRLDYVAQLGQARCHDAIRRKHQDPRACQVHPATSCWLFQGSFDTDSYGQIYLRKNADLTIVGAKPAAFLIHVVSFVASNGRHPIGLHISHLCDTRRCFNPDHLVAETAAMNNARKGCPGPITCSIHGHIVVDLCPHIPRCIRSPRNDVNCCLAIRESDPDAWETQQTQSSSQAAGGVSQASTSSAVSSPNGGPKAAKVLESDSKDLSGSEWLEEAARAEEL
ncbi:hypothetical protein RB595_010538 [Gaeumannomyces hyphopodioides]